MNLWRRIKSTFIRRVDIKNPDSWSAVESSESGEAVTARSAMALSAVWACVNLIAGTTGSLPLGVYRRDGRLSMVASEHPLHAMLSQTPNADQTALAFWEFVAASIELWGNAFAFLERNSRGLVIGMTPISPATVTVRRLPTGELEYRWTQDGQERNALEADVLHIRGVGGDPLGGLSTLSYARTSFGLARAIDRSAASTFKNGMRPAGAMVFKEFLTDDQRRVAEEKLTQKFSGAVNAGRPMILEGGTDWRPFTINPEDAQMLESRRFSVEEICRFFGVPPHMVGHTEKSSSWGTGLEQQTLAFQKFTLAPRLRRVEQAVAKQLLSPAERARGYFVQFDLEALLRADSAGRATYYQTMSQIGAITINEIRERENLPAIDGGSVPRIQMQNQPISEAGE